MGFRELRQNFNPHSESDPGFGIWIGIAIRAEKSDKKGTNFKFKFSFHSNRKVKKILFSL